ncbi:MAG: hypothetical protein NUW37_07755 [Planctomycetes bacterium]|nr:hypothetical protein [Planctomycetota bacterium]
MFSAKIFERRLQTYRPYGALLIHLHCLLKHFTIDGVHKGTALEATNNSPHDGVNFIDAAIVKKSVFIGVDLRTKK